VLLVGDAEAREEACVANGPYTTSYTHFEPRFYALLAEGSVKVLFHSGMYDQVGEDLA
jgi:hypothetical protein